MAKGPSCVLGPLKAQCVCSAIRSEVFQSFQSARPFQLHRTISILGDSRFRSSVKNNLVSRMTPLTYEVD